MAITSQHYLFTFHPIKLHKFLSKLYLTNSSISGILFIAIHMFQKPVSYMKKTLNVADEALCVSDIFCGIHEILLLFNNKKNDRHLNDLSRPSDFHYMFVDI